MRDRQNEYAGVRTRLVRDTRRRPLSADELLESALSRGKRRDFAERSFVHPLAHLLEACNEEADLSVFGIRALRIDVLRCLRSLLHFDAPEECTDITAHVFQSLRFDATYRVPSYNSWLERNGFLNAYRFHRRFLQHLDAQLPGRRWILKAPDHLFALDDVRKVYPDAHLVFVHRDPVRVLASVVKLTEVLRRPFTRSIDRVEIGREVSASWLNGAERMSALSSGDDSVLHLYYRQIASSPLDAVRAVYRHCGLTLTEEAEGRMRSWLRTTGHDNRPGRDYKLAEFGLDPHVLRERFARYTDTFGIEIEQFGRRAGTGALARHVARHGHRAHPRRRRRGRSRRLCRCRRGRPSRRERAHQRPRGVGAPPSPDRRPDGISLVARLWRRSPGFAIEIRVGAIRSRRRG